MIEFTQFEGENYVEITMYDNDNKIGEAQFDVNYDEIKCDGTIFHFLIYDGFRRKGYGKKLMETMLKRLKERGHKHIRIIIGKENDVPTIEFLKKMGFNNIRNSELYLTMEGELKAKTDIIYKIIDDYLDDCGLAHLDRHPFNEDATVHLMQEVFEVAKEYDD